MKVLPERKPEGGVVGTFPTTTAGSPSAGPNLMSSLVSLIRPYENAPPASSLANLVLAYSWFPDGGEGRASHDPRGQQGRCSGALRTSSGNIF